MKVDVELISAALDTVLEQNRVARFGAIPLKSLTLHWDAIHLRAGDLAAGIEELYRQGRVDLEPRRDGLWVRRKGKTAATGLYRKLQASVRELLVGMALGRVRRRRNDGYSGMDRRARRTQDSQDARPA